MTRFQKIVIALLASLVVAVVAGIVIVVQLQTAATAQADFERCMEIHGFTPSKPGNPEDALIAAEACSD